MTGSSERRSEARRGLSTRQRIIQATIALHARGPEASYADIAREAGVATRTVGRQFPDEVALAFACTAEYDRSHPLPKPETWTAIGDRVGRVRAALTELYAYYAENEAVLASGRLALAFRPSLYPAFAHYVELGRRSHRILAEAWCRTPADGTATSAAIGHALEFETWRSLHHEQGLTSSQCVDLMVSFVRGAASAEAGKE